MQSTMNQKTSLSTVSTAASPGAPAAEPRPPRVAYIHSGWHAEIVCEAHTAFVAEMGQQGVPAGQVVLFEVPGAYEIPLHAQALARSGRFDAIVACGLVVDGGIYRHDFVATAVIDGLMRVQLDTSVPVFSVVLTPHHFHEHAEHRDFFRSHFAVKGREAAQACLKTVASLRALPGRATAPTLQAA